MGMHGGQQRWLGLLSDIDQGKADVYVGQDKKVTYLMPTKSPFEARQQLFKYISAKVGQKMARLTRSFNFLLPKFLILVFFKKIYLTGITKSTLF